MEQKMKKTMLIIIGILILAGAFFMFSGNSKITGKVSGNSDEVIRIPLSEISEEAKWYDYDSSETTIRYFAVMANDGTVKTAFDGCDVCFRSKKGYRQEGDVMVCNNCGNRYPITGLGTENKAGGGCWPGYLPSRIEGEDLVIKVSDLKKGEYRFK